MKMEWIENEYIWSNNTQNVWQRKEFLYIEYEKKSKSECEIHWMNERPNDRTTERLFYKALLKINVLCSATWGSILQS